MRYRFVNCRVDVVQNLQGLSYEVCSTNIVKTFRTQIIYMYVSFWDMRHYTPAAGCLVMRTYEELSIEQEQTE